jgi:uncharacterized membrane protein YhaH (DUF805 family)
VCNVSVSSPAGLPVDSIDLLFADGDPDFGVVPPTNVASTTVDQSLPVIDDRAMGQDDERLTGQTKTSSGKDISSTPSCPRQGVLAQRGILWILFLFDGRIPRRVYWCVESLRWLAFQPILVAFQMAIYRDASVTDEKLALVLLGVNAWIFLAVNVKRWHDRGKSGMWLLIWLVPVIGPIWLLVELGFLRGTDGWNDYGPDPT